MIVLSWNYQGLGNPRPVRDLGFLIKDKKPNLVFLMETKLMNKETLYLKNKFSFDNLFTVDCIRRSGGLALFWRNSDEVEIQNYSTWHISAVIKATNDRHNWRFTRFYGHPETAKRKITWQLLHHLSSFQPTPWLRVGDINEITHQTEKYGASTRSRGQMEAL
jgi:hypothetical protein